MQRPNNPPLRTLQFVNPEGLSYQELHPHPHFCWNTKASSAKQRVSCFGQILQVASEEKLPAQNSSKTDAKRNKGGKKFRMVNEIASRRVYTIK